jgi:alpha-ketoglutarate-dependent taurine dioxygenase
VTIATKELGSVGAEVLGVDAERLLRDGTLPAACMAALEEYGVLVFRELHIDDDTQIAFSKLLDDVGKAEPAEPPRIYMVSLDPAKSATEFASTYAAFDDLTAAEKERYAGLRVLHTFEASQRRVNPDPSPEELAGWREKQDREHPLVWRHRSGRRSLVIGVTASHVVGMEVDEGKALLADLLERATTPDRVYRHEWALGDLVIWDNTGVMHRALPYAATSAREMHRTTMSGDEPIR